MSEINNLLISDIRDPKISTVKTPQAKKKIILLIL